jgi:hypothetical protein
VKHSIHPLHLADVLSLNSHKPKITKYNTSDYFLVCPILRLTNEVRGSHLIGHPDDLLSFSPFPLSTPWVGRYLPLAFRKLLQIPRNLVWTISFHPLIRTRLPCP